MAGAAGAWMRAALLTAAMAAGCGSGAAMKPDGSPSLPSGSDGSFAVCSGTPAVDYAPGISVTSASGAYRAALQAAATSDGRGGTPVATAGIGYDTFTVAITAVADGGAPATTDGLTMSIPPVPTGVPADPYMPQHGHGGSTIPAISDAGGGLFTVSNIDFFMGGYWELYLDLQPAGGATKDRVTFLICIPTD